MEHKGTAQLETERLILRKFRINDAEDMFNNWAADPEVTKFMTWNPYVNTDEVRAYIQGCIDDYADEKCYNWIIEYKQTHKAIGSISVVKISEDTACANIGYCFGRKYWHKGITTEAFNHVIKFLFEEVGLNRIEATHDVNNQNSGGVMKKCGLKYEGTLRQAGFNNQGICDMAIYSILKKEYSIK